MGGETKSIYIGQNSENMLDNSNKNSDKEQVNPIKFNQQLQSLLGESEKVIRGEQVLKHGEWIYYLDYSEGMKLYRMKSEAISRTKLVDRFVASFCIVDDWIYYTVKVDGNQLHNIDIYKMKLDGTSKTKIVEGNWIRSFYVVGNSIIYLEESQIIQGGDKVIEPWTRKLKSINIDGTSKKLISDNNLFVDDLQGEWVYYHSDRNDDIFGYIYKTNGTENFQLNKDRSYNVQVSGEWIYYSNMSDSNKIYKIRRTGTERTALPVEGIDKMIVKNDWVYYVNFMGHLYKVKTDGTDNCKLVEDVEYLIGVASDWIFYVDKAGGMHRIHRDKLTNEIL